MVHHSGYIESLCSAHPDHPFNGLALLHEPELLLELKTEHLTLEPTDQVPRATGVPPHIDHAIALKGIFDVCTGISSKLDDQQEAVCKSVREAIDEKVEADGGVNAAIMSKALRELRDHMFAKMDDLFASRGARGAPEPDLNAQPLPVVEDDVRIAGPWSFCYGGKFWCVPKGFQFARGTTRLAGWRKWLKGAVHIDGEQKWRIKPYRLFVCRDFPSKQPLTSYRYEWQPIFREMMKTPGLDIPEDPHDIDDAFVEKSYADATAYLRDRYSFIFSGPDGSTENLLIGTWSKKMRRSYVIKHGTEEDISKLPPATARNMVKRAGVARTSGPLRKNRKVPRRGESRGAMMQRLEEGAGAEAEGDMDDPAAIEGEADDLYDPPAIE